MNRRAFLSWLGAGGAALALDPVLDLERLLWVPGKKTIFIPEPPQITLVTIDMVTREALRVLHNNLAFSGRVGLEYDKNYRISQIAETAAVRYPSRRVRISSRPRIIS